MGRAYPTKWQTTPAVFNERQIVFAAVSVADGNGNVLYMPTATSDLKVEQVIRTALLLDLGYALDEMERRKYL